MNPRYQIDELVTQDLRGVVFHGVDRETGAGVAMRRFLASSGESGGLDPKNKEVYLEAVATMKQVSHPSLRAVLDGGCDAVDGMPYLVTEWTDGDTLRDWMRANGNLTQEVSRHVVGRLLDVCIELSKVFNREALWLETALESVIVSPRDGTATMPMVSFWVCPWRWFGGASADDWRAGVADFAEALLGGPGKAGADPRNAPLMMWVQRIRQKEITTLRAAFAALKVPIVAAGAAPIALAAPVDAARKPAEPFAAAPRPAAGLTLPQPVKVNVRQPSESNGTPRKLVAAAAGLLAMGGVGVWWLTRDGTGAGATAATLAEAADAPHVSTPANQRQAVVDGMIHQIHGEAAAAEERRQAIEARGYYTVREGDLLFGMNGREVNFRGRLSAVRFSNSGLTMYLEFSPDPATDEPRAYAMRRDLVDGIREEDLAPLVGKFIEIRGPVDIETISRTRRPRVNLINRERLIVLPDEDTGPR